MLTHYHFSFLIIISLFSMALTQSFPFSYYYNNSMDLIEFSPSDINSLSTFNIKVNETVISPNPSSTSSNTFSYFSSQLLTDENLVDSYESSQINGTLTIEYYSIKVNDSPLTLIKTYFDNIKEGTITEIIIDFFSEENIIEKKVLPEKYFINDILEVEQNKYISRDAFERRGSKVYETFGFEIIAKNDTGNNFFSDDFILKKIILLNYRKNKLNYLADLSGNFYENTNKTETDNYDSLDKFYDKEDWEIIKKRYDFDLENLPENFDLILTLDILDKEGKEKGEKVVVVKKGFQYPNFKVEEPNPNQMLFITSLCGALLAIVVGAVFASFTICSETVLNMNEK